MATTQPKHVIVISWFARIASVPLILFVILFFLEDGLPFFLFVSDPIHMTALSLMLLGFLAGWKWDGLAAGLILIGFLIDWLLTSIRYGQIVLNLGPIFSFFPFIGLMYLYCWWHTKRAALPA